MPTLNSTQTDSYGVAHSAAGSIRTSSAAAAALTINVGFIPRIVRFHNVTDRISDEWISGMDEAAIFQSIVGIAAKLDADAGVTDTDYTALWTPASQSGADLKAAIAGILAKLDLDGGVTDTNFAALWTPAGTTAAQLKASLVGMNAKLDADAGVTDTNYGATWNVVAVSLHTVAAGTRTLGLSNGILNNQDGTFTLSATTMVASKAFAWEAVG